MINERIVVESIRILYLLKYGMQALLPPLEGAGGTGAGGQKLQSLSHLRATVKHREQSGHAEGTLSAETERGSIIRDLFMMRSALPNVTGASRADSAVRLRLDFSKTDGSENNDGVPLSFFSFVYLFIFFFLI